MKVDLIDSISVLNRAIDDSGIPLERAERHRIMRSYVDLTLDEVDSRERARLADRQAFRRSQIKGMVKNDSVRPVPLDRLESNRRLDLTN